jgi:hypothetical protein
MRTRMRMRTTTMMMTTMTTMRLLPGLGAGVSRRALQTVGVVAVRVVVCAGLYTCLTAKPC